MKLKNTFVAALLLVTAALLTLPTAYAAERQFQDVIWQESDNWKALSEQDGVMRFRPRLDGRVCSRCYLKIARSVPIRGSLADFTMKNLNRFRDDDERRIEPIGTAKVFTSGRRDMALLFGKTKSDLFALSAINFDGQVVLSILNGKLRNAEDLRDTYTGHVLPFLNSLRVVTGDQEGLLPAAKPGDVSGIYYTWVWKFIPDPNGTGYSNLFPVTLVFYPDGHFYDGSPPESIYSLDRAALRAAGEDDFGIYSKIGKNTIWLTYADGRKKTLTRDKKTSGWTIDDDTYEPIDALPDGARIQGKLSNFDYQSFSEGFGLSGGAASGSDIEFHLDGTYTGESYGSVAADFGGGGTYSSSSKDRSGSYEVRNGLLVMTGKDGVQRKQIIYELDGDYVLGERVLTD